jgi:membrane protease YdiL (CAAX protease family)
MEALASAGGAFSGTGTAPRGVLRPGRLLRLRRMAWGVVLTLAVGLATLPVNLSARLFHIRPGTPASAGLLVVALAAMIAAYAAAVTLGERRKPRELDPAFLPELGIGLAVGVAVFGAAMAILLAGGWYTVTAGPPGTPWRGLIMSIGAGTAEELLFRGILMRLLWQGFGWRIALAASAILFGLAHIANPGHAWLGPVFIVFEAGLLLGGLFALTGRLWASIGAHAGWNFAQGYVFGAEVSGADPGGHWLHAAALPGAPALMTGGAFGPEASLPGLAAGTAAGIVAIALAWRRRRPNDRAVH